MAMVISGRSKAVIATLLLLVASALLLLLLLLVAGSAGWFPPRRAPPPPFPGEYSEFYAPWGPVGSNCFALAWPSALGLSLARV